MLILSGADVERLLDMRACIDAVENGFRALADPDRAQAGVLGLHVPGGGFHMKAATLVDDDGRRWFAAKLNANFPDNPRTLGLPTIQGMLTLSDGANGTPLVVMDSAALTIIRTAAATGVAAKHLARADASVVAIVGAGAQAPAQLEAVRCVRDVRQVRVFDVDAASAERFAQAHGASAARSLADAARGADIVITCTPSRAPFLRREHLADGAFIAAVGADNEEKSEIDPALMRETRVVVDSLEQCERIGDLHHAIAAGAMSRTDIAGTLSDVVLGRARHTRDQRITIFDSTGVAIEDVAAARLVYLGATASASAPHGWSAAHPA